MTRKIGGPSGRNQNNRTPETESNGFKIKTLPAMRVALLNAFEEGLGPTIAEAAGMRTDDIKPFIKNNGQLPNGAFGRLREAIKLGK